MKNLMKSGLLIGLLAFSTWLRAQDASLPKISDDLSSQIPVNPKVKIGKLDNGLTYIIRENKKPEKRLHLRLVVNAGSILEDEDQLGLAHFTEHMAFNGSEHFKKNELVDYLQSIGVEFGSDLNAYTSFDQTVYMLPIPTDDAKIVDQGFQIIRDWAGGLLFDHTEIDKERGVIVEEWRRGRGANMRMLDKFLPTIFKDSRYAKRLPIGEMDIVENFDYEVIKRFYKDWYRPDLMAVVAVGDLPAEQIEEKIKSLFADLKLPASPRKRKEFEVPNHPETLVQIVKDAEAAQTRVMAFFKGDVESRNTLEDYKRHIVSSMVTSMINERLNELRQQANPPFIYSGSSYGGFWARTKNAYQSFALVDEAKVMDGLKAMITENERVKKFGFTEAELKRFKLRFKKSMETAYKERDKTESGRMVDELINHYLENEPIPGIEFEYAFVNKFIDGVSVEEVNNRANELIKEDNRVIIVTGPDKEGVDLPSEEDIKLALAAVKDQKIEAYKEEEISQNLIETLPAVGQITKSSVIDEVGVTKLQLSNGITVFLKKTDFKNDQILFSAYREGGHSIVDDELYMSAKAADEVVTTCGVGDYSATTLKKALAGKSVSVSPYIGALSEGMSGSSTPDDLETFFQLIHLYFTSPRKDEEAFQGYIQRNKSMLANVNANPKYYFYDQTQRIMSQDHYRGDRIPTIADVDKINMNKALDFYKTRFANPYGFAMWFVGNFDENTLKEYLKKYVASIEDEEQAVKSRDLGIRPPSGQVKKDIIRGQEPQSSVHLTINKPAKYSRKDASALKVLGEILSIKLIEVVREDEGGVYSIRASASATNKPYDHYNLTVRFPCAPENVDKLVGLVKQEIKKLVDDGPQQKDLDKVVETTKRTIEESIQQNGFWLGQLSNYYQNGWNDYDNILKYAENLESIKAKKLQKVAKKYLDTEDFIQITLLPESKE